MSESRFEKLVQLRKADYQATYEFVNNHFQFIEIFLINFSRYFECGNQNLSFIKPSTGNSEPYWKDTVEIDEDGFFNFGLQIMLPDKEGEVPAFNINNSGRDFSEKGLLPSAGVGFALAAKQKEGSLFIVKTPTETFEINSQKEESFYSLFELIYKDLEKVLSAGLVERIKGLKNQSDEKPTIGFLVS